MKAIRKAKAAVVSSGEDTKKILTGTVKAVEEQKHGSNTKDGLQKAKAGNPQENDKTSELVERVELMQEKADTAAASVGDKDKA